MKNFQDRILFPGSINWNSKTDEIIRFVSENKKNNKPAFSFIFGFKIIISRCERFELGLDDYSTKEAGTILKTSGKDFLVKSSDGCVLMTDYVIHTPYRELDNMEEFLKKSRVKTEPKFTRIAFTNNEEANLWETLYQKFVMSEEQLESIEGSMNNQPIILEPKISEQQELEIENGEKLINLNRGFIQYLIDKINLSKGSRVLDLGCGSGWASSIFANKGMETHGGDISPLCIRQAKISVPKANFFVLDIFDLLNHENLKGKFDLVFCRDLGVAQKIVDWEDEKWQNVGKGLIEILSDRGVLYWIQMSDLSEQIYETGFSNPSLKTLKKFFNKFGQIVDFDIFSYQCFLITRKNPKPQLLSHIEEFNRIRHNNIYSWWLKEKNLESSKEFAKVIYSKISKVLLLDDEIKNRGAIVFGNNKIAQAYFHLLNERNLFRGFCWEKQETSYFLGQKIMPFKASVNLKPSVLVLTEPEQKNSIENSKLKSSFQYIVKPFEFNENFTREKIYLLSADQDEAISDVLLSPLTKILN